MSSVIDVAIVGAGPYGLSLAAHVSRLGVCHRVFGRPMRFWRECIPPGTCLKSDGESSDLPAPAAGLSFAAFRRDSGRPFCPTTPIALADFVAYGETFLNRFVSASDPSEVTRLSRVDGGFHLVTSSGEVVAARRVVLAIGIGPFRFVPEILRALPPGFVSHSAEYGPVGHLAGRRVAVIGSGASAVDVAAVAHEAGADVTIVSGRGRLAFHSAPAPRRWWQKLRRPDTGIGAGWSHWFFVHAAPLFHRLPAGMRIRIATTALGPAPAWFMKDRILGHVPVLEGCVLTDAAVEGGVVCLDLAHDHDGPQRFVTDHVIAATGYRVDMRRLGFLDATVMAGLRLESGAAVLSSQFETSVPNLYVIGPAAAHSFGPVLRFVHGAAFAVPRLARHLSRRAATHSAPTRPTAMPVAAPEPDLRCSRKLSEKSTSPLHFS